MASKIRRYSSEEPKTIAAIRISSKTGFELLAMAGILSALALAFGIFGFVQYQLCQKKSPGITVLKCFRNEYVSKDGR